MPTTRILVNPVMLGKTRPVAIGPLAAVDKIQLLRPCCRHLYRQSASDSKLNLWLMILSHSTGNHKKLLDSRLPYCGWNFQMHIKY